MYLQGSFLKFIVLPGIFSFLMLTGLWTNSSAESRLAVIGEVEDLSELTEEENNAYQWALLEYSADYISFQQLLDNNQILDDYDVVWWHFDKSFDLPAISIDETIIDIINDFVTSGGGLFLSRFATQYTVDLGIQSTPPDEIARSPSTSGNWGFYQMRDNHPAFEGLNNPFATLSSGLQVDNAISWWTNPDNFDGIWLTDLEWRSEDGPDIVSSGEYRHGSGRVYVVGAGAFEWHHGGTNSNRHNLERYTRNIIDHLERDEIHTVSFLVEDAGQIEGDQQAAFNWLDTIYTLELVEFSTIANSGFSEETDVIWWHHTASVDLPEAALVQEVINRINTTVGSGVGLKLSGLAASYVDNLGLTTAPDQYAIYESTPDAHTIDTQISNHRIFDDLPSTFQIRSNNSAVNHSAVWSDPSDFDGTWLASDNRSGEVVAIGSINNGSGRVLVAGTDAYNWQQSIDTEYFSSFEQLVINIFDFISTPAPEIDDGLVIHFPLDGQHTDRQATEQVSGREVTISNNYDRPEWVDAPTGTGLRLDGFSTWINYNEPAEQIPSDQLTVKLWAAVESYPPTNAPFVNNYTFPGAGYYLGMEPHGNWYFALSVDGQWHTVWGDGPFPKYEWNHIAGVFDKDDGLRLYLNGELVGTQNTPAGVPMTPDTDNPTILGRDIHTGDVAGFPTGVVNGIIDDVRIYNTARTNAQIQEISGQGDAGLTPDLEVPDSRYADDPHRPAFHAMPPAHWANEPHGLVYHDDRFHLFYQYNPSGPYWAHIHWGHISTNNLVNWEDHPIALAPEPGFDSYGIWSGDAVVDSGVLKTIYTGVDGTRARVGLAEMIDFGDFRKHPQNPLFQLPPGNFEDFRDPYVWQEGNDWFLLIGSGIPNGGGGTSLLYRSNDLVNWEFRGEVMGEGDPAESGEYWEMPMIKQLTDDIYYFGVTDLPIGRNTYWLGEWENETFTPNHDEPSRLDLINRFLSPAIERTPDGRIVAIGIIPNHITTEYARELGWEHVFSFPREWYYHEEDEILGQRPARELENLRGSKTREDLVTFGEGRANVLSRMSGTQFEMIVDISMADAEQAGVILRATADRDEQTRIYYDATTKEIVVDLSQASHNPQTERDIRSGDFELKDGERLKLHVFVDNSVIEVFVNDKHALATRVFPTSPDSDLVDLFAAGGTANATVDFWELDPSQVTSSDEELADERPGSIQLYPNYPNPFNSRTNITFDLPQSADVQLEVFNILGQRVRRLVDSMKSAGTHRVAFDASSLASGVYIYRLRTGNEILSRKMLLLE